MVRQTPCPPVVQLEQLLSLQTDSVAVDQFPVQKSLFMESFISLSSEQDDGPRVSGLQLPS